ncbi:hypothetical protein BDF14DRAFT_1887425 [Spinellus fusiger]|nr:hypothetical protein BDF14DRAFT_1887425 [Spinellus fusiger]
MSHSFLVHVSKTLSRSSVHQSLLSQLTAPANTLGTRSLSTSSLALWGGETIAQSLRASGARSVLFTLQPLHSATAVRRVHHLSRASTSMHLKENTSDDGSLPSNSGNGNNTNGAEGGSSSSGGQGDHNDGWDDGKPHRPAPEVDNQLQKPTVPDVYPQVLALPITRRPLFPGFYKAVLIKDPQVTSAIKELLKRGQPYIGAFMLKDETLDVDTITSVDQVYPVGVFAQITSVFPASSGKDGKEEAGLTAVLYPHRRIKMTELLVPRQQGSVAAVEAMETVKNSIATTATTTTEDTAKKVEDTVKRVEDESYQGKHEKLLHGTMEETRDRNTHTEMTVGTQEELLEGTREEVLEKAQEQTESNSSQELQYASSFLAQDYNVSLATVENLIDAPFSNKSPMVRALTSEIVSVFKEIASLNSLFRDQIASFSMSQSAGNVFEEPAKLADFAASVSAGEQVEIQEVLETLSIEDRLQKSLVVLKKELMNAQLQNKISKEVETKIAKRQREYYLMEQMKGIKKELGLESDGKDKLVEGFKEKALKLAMPSSVKKVFDEEINKLTHLEPAASEFSVTRNYLDWLTQVPWGKRSYENYSIGHARKVLDEDHYGLQDVKDRILEFVAVGKLAGTVEGKILCLSGPPGVGKTSIGKSIARALDREFYRFSVGGLTDVAEIKGHRRTYVGAMPGKVIQALKKVQTENPLVLIDEIDKIGRGHQGDPSSALLELLDPEQNSSFLDHYMDVPVDLSKILFICTANVLDTIPGPLLDRMEVIELSGYIAEEKSAIASKYLAPAAKIAAGLENVNVNLTEEAVNVLIKNYCRESGVRNLKKHIDKVFRKAAYKVVEKLGETVDEKTVSSKTLEEGTGATDVENKETVLEGEVEKTEQHIVQVERKPMHVPKDVVLDVTVDNLKDYVGPAIFDTDRLYERTIPGVVMGLAWTNMGGSSLYIESVLESSLTPQSSAHLSSTGQWSLMATQYPKNKFFEKARLHLHCPAGAVPKDEAVSPTIAMTGELTVTGKVLKIGGLKEKTIAAKRSNVTTILFPKNNTADWEELPEHIKQGMTGIPVDYYSDVFKACFGDLESDVEDLWKTKLSEDNNKSN